MRSWSLLFTFYNTDQPLTGFKLDSSFLKQRLNCFWTTLWRWCKSNQIQLNQLWVFWEAVVSGFNTWKHRWVKLLFLGSYIYQIALLLSVCKHILWKVSGNLNSTQISVIYPQKSMWERENQWKFLPAALNLPSPLLALKGREDSSASKASRALCLSNDIEVNKCQ